MIIGGIDSALMGFHVRPGSSPTVVPGLRQGLDLIIYGDSITEQFRGMLMGVHMDKFKGIPEVFTKHYGRLKAKVFSIAGALRGPGGHRGLTQC